MTPIIETAQVVIVLALLPLVLLCLLLVEPFDHLRLRQPRRPKPQPVKREARRAAPALESELA